MKKIYLYVVITLFITAYSFGQINNTWRLGPSDINFATNPPIAGNNYNTNSYYYGNASVSDATTGALLFYTDGLKIYTNQDNPMTVAPNVAYVYSLINASSNNMQPAIIVPNLANNKQYYVFLSALDQGIISSSIYALTIDFSDPNHSDGIISAIDTSMGSRYDLFAPLTVVKNATNDAYFVITSGVKNGTNGDIELRSYKITSTDGLNLSNPAKTDINSAVIGYSNFISSGGGYNSNFSNGIIKFAPNGTTLGILVKTDYDGATPSTCPHSKSQFSTCIFDNNTGLFNTFVPQQFGSNNMTSYIGTITDFDFSSNSNNVYFIAQNPNNINTVFNRISVKNLSNTNPPRQLTSPTDSSPDGFQNITRDRYGNILISSNHYYSGSIQRIENQDDDALASINLSYINLNGNDLSYFNNYYLQQLIPEIAITPPTCLSSQIITTNITTGVDQKQASVSISASNTISNGAGAIYHAPTVVLKPGFLSVKYSTAHIYTASCTGTYAAKNRSTKKSISNTETKTAVEFIKIFPNPNHGVFKISLNEITNGTITVTDIYGHILYQSDFKNQSEFDMNLQDKSKGIYIVKVISGNKTEVKKIIIQ